MIAHILFYFIGYHIQQEINILNYSMWLCNDYKNRINIRQWNKTHTAFKPIISSAVQMFDSHSFETDNIFAVSGLIEIEKQNALMQNIIF